MVRGMTGSNICKHNKDVIALHCYIIFAYVTCYSLGIAETVFEIIQKHKELALDKLILLCVIISIGFIVFSVRTVKKLKNQIEKQKKIGKELQTLSLTDEMTGLHNRRGFLVHLNQLLKTSIRQNQGFYILYADLDNLKTINDRLGHKEGDIAITVIADILKTNFRDADVVSRIGGDEFVVAPVGKKGDNPEHIARRLQKQLTVHNKKNNSPYNLSVSIGIAYYDPHYPCSIDTLIANADTLMYKQKLQKKNVDIRCLESAA
jgi:diguanylate cyclase (GGDEF)-like protein